MTDSHDTSAPESPQGVDRKAEGGCPVMHDSAAAEGSEWLHGIAGAWQRRS